MAYEDNEVLADLQYALDDMVLKRSVMDNYYDMYNGLHPRIWLTRQLRRMFSRKMQDTFVNNWIEMAVDAVLARMEVVSFTPRIVRQPDDRAEGTNDVDRATALFESQSLDLEQVDLYRDMLVAGEAFLFAWNPGQPGNPEPGEYDEGERGSEAETEVVDPRFVSWPCGSERDNPRVVTLCLPDVEPDEYGLYYWRATMYYRRDVVRLKGPRFNPALGVMHPTDADAFEIDPDDEGGPHGFDRVPVTRFADRRGAPVSWIKKLIPPQNKLNKIESNKMVAAEMAAFLQRIYLTTQKLSPGMIDADPSKAIILDPGGDEGTAPTSVTTIPPTPLANYDDSIGKELVKFFTLATLPKHLLGDGSMSNVSGEAFEASEVAFNFTLKGLRKVCTAGWRSHYDLFGMDVEPVWDGASAKGEQGQLEAFKTAVEAGMPRAAAAVRYLGMDPDEADRVMGASEPRSAPEPPQGTDPTRDVG